ncbi:acyl-coenzyme A oxidase 2 [Diutina catenulata]
MVRVTSKVDYTPAQNPAGLIAKERANAAWDPVKMNYFLESSKENSEMIAEITEQLDRDPIMATSPATYDQTKEQQREVTALKISRLTRYLEIDSEKKTDARLSMIGVMDPQSVTRPAVHLKLWIPAIRGNGTKEQYNYWVKNKSDVITKIYGCFGMTELAHGSNVPGIETTATFDQETDEFVINTPHIGATKWWIGGAAHSATHCAVYARLIVKGQDYGVKVFTVPLRDAHHNLCPGVTVGDIGAKMGRDGIDNGWIQFSHVRVPRFFMLQKFAKVSRDGEVTLPPLEQLSYSALLGGRVGMVVDSYRMIAKMTTIALRYAVGRTQFPKDGEEGEELQIIDYALHQRRLFPYLSVAYVASAGMYKLANTMYQIMEDIEIAVEKNDLKSLGASINTLKGLFVDSAALKSNLTWTASACIDECRQACGGHGYSSYNAFGKAFSDWSVQCTWEGDNNMLGVTAGRSILKNVGGALKGKTFKGDASYLNQAKDVTGANADKYILNSAEDVTDLKKFLKAVQVGVIRSAAATIDDMKANGTGLNDVGAELIGCTRLWAYQYLIEEFIRRVDSHDDKSVVPYLKLQGQYYAAGFVLQQCSSLFLSHSLISPKVYSEVTSKVLPRISKEIRPHIINYTDSFQQSDMILNAAIGKYDGNIYDNYFDTVKAQNPPFQTKAPYSAALEAMLARGELDARDRFEKTGETAKTLSR